MASTLQEIVTSILSVTPPLLFHAAMIGVGRYFSAKNLARLSASGYFVDRTLNVAVVESHHPSAKRSQSSAVAHVDNARRTPIDFSACPNTSCRHPASGMPSGRLIFQFLPRQRLPATHLSNWVLR